MGDGTSATLATKPADWATDDVVLAIVTTSQDSDATTAFSGTGWTTDAGSFFNDNAGAAYINSGFLWRQAGASGPYTISKVGDTANDQLIVHFLAFSGVDTTTPIAATPAATDAAVNATSLVAPAVTPAAGLPSQAMLICAWVSAWFIAGGVGADRWGAVPAGMTEGQDYGGAWSQMVSAYQLVDSGSSTGTRTMTAPQAGANGVRPRGLSIALRPAATATGPSAGRRLLLTG